MAFNQKVTNQLIAILLICKSKKDY